MLPSVFPGDTLLVERSDGHEVAEGDIVIFSRDRRLFAHRVIGRSNQAEVVTQGDAMRAPDPLVRRGEMLGKVLLISRNGKFIQPRKRMRISERAVAALVRNSEVAARVVVSVHGVRQTWTV